MSFLFVEAFVPPCVATPDFLHAAMRPDMIAETEVEISTEDCIEEEDEEMVTLMEEPEPVRKRRGIYLTELSCDWRKVNPHDVKSFFVVLQHLLSSY